MLLSPPRSRTVPGFSVRGKAILLLVFCVAVPCASILATDNYEYGDDEYVTITNGISPNGRYAITAHGEGEYGYDNFHLFLTDAVTGARMSVLKEIVEPLDTGAGSYGAKWAGDSHSVVIVYRIDRHEPLKVVSYRIADRQAFLIKGPVDANNEQTRYWGKYCSGAGPSKKTFGTPKQHGEPKT